jgi:membrane-anchored protein YejM (alkaline phosphatase superfamily)
MNLLAIVGGAWLALLLVGSLVASWAIRRNRKHAEQRRAMRRWLGSDFRK